MTTVFPISSSIVTVICNGFCINFYLHTLKSLSVVMLSLLLTDYSFVKNQMIITTHIFDGHKNHLWCTNTLQQFFVKTQETIMCILSVSIHDTTNHFAFDSYVTALLVWHIKRMCFICAKFLFSYTTLTQKRCDKERPHLKEEWLLTCIQFSFFIHPCLGVSFSLHTWYFPQCLHDSNIKLIQCLCCHQLQYVTTTGK